MSKKIALVAEKICNELKVIKQLRDITGRSISEIKACLKNKTPFYVADESSYATTIASEEILKKILRFTKKDGDTIMLFNIDEDEILDNRYEVTQEAFEEEIESRPTAYFDEMAEEFPFPVEIQCSDDEMEKVLQWCWHNFGPCFGIPPSQADFYPGCQAILAIGYMDADFEQDDFDFDGVWTTYAMSKTALILFKSKTDRDVFLKAIDQSHLVEK